MEIISIERSGLTADEADAAASIETNLKHLQLAAQEFSQTLALFLHIRELVQRGLDTWLKVSWTRIAGRNGAIEAYGFWMAMQEINSARIPTLLPKVNKVARKAATDLFSSEFPTAAGFRNTTAHPGELSRSPKAADKNRLKSPLEQHGVQLAEGAFISDMMTASDDRLTMSASLSGNHVEFELSKPKATVLEKVAALYCEAYRPLEGAESALRRQWRP